MNDERGQKSVLESLYELCINQDPVHNDKNVRQLFVELRERTACMSLEERDWLTGMVAELCVAYSCAAFHGGTRLAGTLLLEILEEKQFVVDLRT